MWSRPVLRGTEEGHRQATWLELFFDLIFVVAVAQLAGQLSQDVSWAGAGRYLFVYLPVWMSWTMATFYSNRFDTDDLGQRLITFGQMLAVAGMAAAVAEATAVQFAASMAVFRLLVVASYVRVRSSVPGGMELANRMIGLLAISAGIWVGSIFIDGTARFVAWALAIGFELAAALAPSTRQRTAAVPLSMSHIPERFGLFTIIVLGETVLAVVIGVTEAHWVASAAVFAPIGLTISFSLWWIYFESVTGTVLRRLGGVRPVLWVFAHAPLVIAITALGVGIEHAVLEAWGDVLDTADAVLLAGSLAGALLAVAVLLAAEARRDLSVRVFLKRVPAALLVLAVGMLPIAAQAVVVGLAVLAGTQAVIDVRARRL